MFWAFVIPNLSRGAVALDALGSYLTQHGYGGAQLVPVGKFYHLPVSANGKPGNLIIDTGSPATLIFRSSVKELGLTESKTTSHVRGAFGPSREFYGTATIKELKAGNCTLTNVPVAVAPVVSYGGRHANASGVLGLRELVKFAAILDLSHHLVYFTSSRPNVQHFEAATWMRTKNGWRLVPPGSELSQMVRSILTEQGWTPVPFSIAHRHLRIAGAANGASCYFMLDTGSYLTLLDAAFAKRARIGDAPARIAAQGIGRSATDVRLAIVPAMRIGSYEIKPASATVAVLDSEAIGRGTDSEVAGLLGIEHLAMNSAIFDFTSRQLYLRPRANH
ncbi:MAG TPA: aspartyl protease family protein [Chthoniobacterales bacterium]|nr:aspartyl protease family protein [Chthoniobacterales bacterium]